MAFKPVIWSMQELADATKERIKNRFDTIMVVTGFTGVGKSTFIWKFFRKSPDFKIKDKLTFSREKMIHLIRDYNNSYVFADELISSFNKRKFYDTEQIELIEILTKYRNHFHIIAGAVPVFFSLDKELLKLIGIHINIPERGLAIIHLPKKGRMFVDDLWDIRTNQRLE